DPSSGGRGYPGGKMELPGGLAGHAPGALELAGRRESVDAAIAVAVGDVQVAVRADGHVGRTVERPAGAGNVDRILAIVASVRRRVHRPERREQLAGRRELAHGVVAGVRAEDRPRGADGDGVGAMGRL